VSTVSTFPKITIGLSGAACILPVLLLASCYLAWSDEHKKVPGLQVQPPREGPDFHPSIVNSVIYPAGDPANSVVGIVRTIYNKGDSGTLNDIFIDAILMTGEDFGLGLLTVLSQPSQSPSGVPTTAPR
jgi:hypothetical protein